MAKWKDYSLTGPQGVRAREAGLVSAEWYACPIPRKEMKALMTRRDGPAIRDTLIWFAVLAVLAVAMWQTWGSWWFAPVFLVYAQFYAACAGSRWHECGHNTAFKTRWMNDAVYYLASFMTFRNGNLWRWSHARHHTDTIIVGRDPEIAISRPPSFFNMFLQVLYLGDARIQLGRMLRFSLGRMNGDEADFVPQAERGKLFLEARIQLAIYLSVIALAGITQSWLPLFYIGLPTFFGMFLDVVIFGYCQHAGLAEDVLDHRMNCRTVYFNPVSRFIYWNMNYHLEHHMFPMVPYHALPKLHEAMKPDCPPPYPDLLAAWREILPALWRQRHDPHFTATRPLPAGAAPFRSGPALQAAE